MREEGRESVCQWSSKHKAPRTSPRDVQGLEPGVGLAGLQGKTPCDKQVLPLSLEQYRRLTLVC